MNEEILNSHNKEEYPPMHTAEHVLNGVISRKYGCPRAFTTHIERKKSKIDFRLDHQPDRGELDAIEREVNDILARQVDVMESVLPREEAAARFDLSRLPEAAGERVLIVRVGDYDAFPCIGSHVSNTAEVQPIRIISADCTEGVLRVRFKFNKG